MSVFTDRDDALLQAHLRELRLLGDTGASIYARERAIRRLQAALAVPVSAATVADLYAWRASLTVSPTTICHYVSHAHCFYDWLIGQHVRADNPAEVLPVPRKPRRLPRPVAAQDLALALATAPAAKIRVILVLAAFCGLRAKEIALLRREAVIDTAQAPFLLLAAEVVKGGRRERAVPLHPFALGELRALPMPATGWILPRGDGRPGPNTPARICHLANIHMHGQGIAASLHQLRHWFGTMTYEADHDLRVVQELLGHADPASTAGYAAISSAGARAAVESLPIPHLLRPITGKGQAS